MKVATAPVSLSASRLFNPRSILDAKMARTLGAADPAELDALVQEIETALARVGYHWRSSQASRAQRNRRPKRKTAAPPIGPGRPGRPRGAQNFAARQLGLELAMIWFERTGRPPTRYESKPGSQRGSFTEFVAAIAELEPLIFRKSGSSRMPEVEYLVRNSIADFRAARSAPEEYRRRGLIDERLWLGPLANDKA